MAYLRHAHPSAECSLSGRMQTCRLPEDCAHCDPEAGSSRQQPGANQWGLAVERQRLAMRRVFERPQTYVLTLP
jgi:hypothetical protein